MGNSQNELSAESYPLNMTNAKTTMAVGMLILLVDHEQHWARYNVSDWDMRHQ